MKKFIIAGTIIILGIGTYVLYTLKSGQELDEASPLQEAEPSLTPPSGIKDNLDMMSEEQMSEFMREVEAMKSDVMEKAEVMPAQAALIARGDFMKRFHGVEGRALLIQDGDERIVRFEDFETDNGPKLHIYLSADLGADDFIDLGPIKATKGNVNYTVPAGTDTGKYRNVLVWCKPFGVLFSYAELASL